MKKPMRVAVTRIAEQIGYSLLLRVASGEMLGKDQPVILQLLEIPDEKAQKALKGVMMELDDCAFPLLQSMVPASDPKVAFKDVDVALLVGARPRGPGMERKDLLEANGAIFVPQGKALDEVASRDVKVLVVGNPANTNSLIAMKNAPSLKPTQFTAMMRLDLNRALTQVAQKDGQARDVGEEDVDLGQSLGHAVPRRLQRRGGRPGDAAKLINDQAWIEGTFITTVQQRGAAIIEARGASSAASAANAAIDHVRDWVCGTASGDWVSMEHPVRWKLRHSRRASMFGYPVTVSQGRPIPDRPGRPSPRTTSRKIQDRRHPQGAPGGARCDPAHAE